MIVSAHLNQLVKLFWVVMRPVLNYGIGLICSHHHDDRSPNGIHWKIRKTANHHKWSFLFFIVLHMKFSFSSFTCCAILNLLLLSFVLFCRRDWLILMSLFIFSSLLFVFYMYFVTVVRITLSLLFLPSLTDTYYRYCCLCMYTYIPFFLFCFTREQSFFPVTGYLVSV